MQRLLKIVRRIRVIVQFELAMSEPCVEFSIIRRNGYRGLKSGAGVLPAALLHIDAGAKLTAIRCGWRGGFGAIELRKRGVELIDLHQIVGAGEALGAVVGTQLEIGIQHIRSGLIFLLGLERLGQPQSCRRVGRD